MGGKRFHGSPLLRVTAGKTFRPNTRGDDLRAAHVDYFVTIEIRFKLLGR